MKMSLKNSGKINLFELKNQNKYAQLVETQSPEQKKEIDKQSEEATTRSSTINKQLPSSSALLPSMSHEHNFEQKQPVAPNQDATSQQRIAENTSRKGSQCSSQISTSFISSTSSDQACTSTTATTDPCYSLSINQLIKVNKNPSISNATNTNNANHAGLTNMHRTISQSMLKLDQSSRLDNFEVSWRDLSFSYIPNKLINFKKSQTHILRNISGRFQSNQLVSIIGPSGCGKTTLLQFLAGNNSQQRDKLKIIGLDEPKVAFIGQGDCLLPGLTAKETLIYASRLQNSSDKSFNHVEHIQPILDALGLDDCSDRNVTKLSGGQAKRVTIAQELLYPTNILILDEVTSGLDASTSYSIVKLLKQLVSDKTYPMSIVMSIHQPSAKLFAIFDQVYVMSEGCCLYEGSCEVNLVNKYLNRFGLECPKFHNIADYLIEISSEDNYTNNNTNIRNQMVLYQSKRSQVRDNSESFEDLTSQDINNSSTLSTAIDQDSSIFNENEERYQNIPMLMNSNLYDAIERARSKRERPIMDHFIIHFNRSTLRIRRSYILTYLQLITYIILGLQLATFYGSNIGTLSGCPRLPLSFMSFVFSNDSEIENLNLESRRIQENMNFLLVSVLTATFAALEITVITFPLEAKTVKREWRNGWYRVSSYFMGRTLADLPFQIAFVITFCIVIYTLTGQIGLTTWRFASFVTIIIMTALIAQAVGFIFGALFMDNLPAAVFTAPLCIFPALLFSGFFSRVSQIPSFYKPMTYISHFRYAFDALLVTLYGYNRCECDQETLDSYHKSLHNQTGTIKNVFKSLFGSVDCGDSSDGNININNNDMNQDENSIEDATTSRIHETILNNSSTIMPRSFSTIEDVLVDSVFEHINQTSTRNGTSSDDGSAMDHLVNKFSHKLTSMLNRNSNFGHEMAESCQNFQSYLMTEFDLHNDDLMFGLLMLLAFVLLTRLLCNTILTFTIATRTT